MHRLIFCTICLLALLGVFGPGDFGSSTRTATVSASDGAIQRARVATAVGQPLELAANQAQGDVTWTVRQAPPQAQHLLGQTLAHGSAHLMFSAEEARRLFAVPGTYILRAEGSAGVDEIVVTVNG